jgi:hypothetical protein
VGLQLRQEVGGPRLVVSATVTLVLALAVAAAVVWLATVSVRERHLVAGGPAPERLRVARVLMTGAVLFVATSAAFAALESYLHWRAGLGFHALHCLTGPVHRDALPFLGGLSLVAAACSAAADHLIGWMRRSLAALARDGVAVWPSAPIRTPHVPPAPGSSRALRRRSRAPPAVAASA